MTLSWKDIPRWADVLTRAGIERLGASAFACALPSPSLPDECKFAAWQSALQDLRALPAFDRIVGVDRAVNALPYVSDLRNWGMADRWATPIEMITRGGDCEDYALTKYFALRDLGFPEASMRLAIVWDMQDDEQHAVLFVENDGARWILDNKLDGPAPADLLARRYRLIYGLDVRGASFAPAALGVHRADGPRLADKGRTLVFRTRPVRRGNAAVPAIARAGAAPAQHASDTLAAVVVAAKALGQANAAAARLGRALQLLAEFPLLDAPETAGSMPVPIA